MSTLTRRQFVGRFGATVAAVAAIQHRMPGNAAETTTAKEKDKAEGTPFQMATSQRQLFLDDADVARQDNLRRTLHSPDKKGAVIRTDRAIGGYPETRCAPAWDPEAKIWKLWTVCVTPEDLHGVGGLSGYHESTDGVNWSAPRLRKVEYKGSRENNFVFIPVGDGRTGEIFCAVYDGTEANPARRYKGFTYANQPKSSILFATSPDGIDWSRVDVPPIPSFDETNFSFDELHHLFLATVKVNGPFGRSHALTTSSDFARWTEPTLVFHADSRDQEMAREVIARHLANPLLQQPVYNHPDQHATDVYNFAISRYESRYIGFASFFYHTGHAWGTNHDGFHQVQLAVSRDLKKWERVGDRQPFLAPSPLGAGAYDTMQVIGPSKAVLRDDELWFYYTGIRHRYPPANMSWDRSAICLATLRRDGFVSLDAGDQEGVLTTQPFRYEAARLYVNADAAGGQIACELLDRAGNPLAGFERGESRPITSDSPNSAVSWKQHDRLPAPSDQPVRLRLFLRKARLFSYWGEA